MVQYHVEPLLIEQAMREMRVACSKSNTNFDPIYKQHDGLVFEFDVLPSFENSSLQRLQEYIPKHHNHYIVSMKPDRSIGILCTVEIKKNYTYVACAFNAYPPDSIDNIVAFNSQDAIIPLDALLSNTSLMDIIEDCINDCDVTTLAKLKDTLELPKDLDNDDILEYLNEHSSEYKHQDALALRSIYPMILTSRLQDAKYFDAIEYSTAELLESNLLKVIR